MSTQNQSNNTAHTDDGTGCAILLRYIEEAGPYEAEMLSAEQAEKVMGFLMRSGIDAVLVDTSVEPHEVVGGVDVVLAHWWFDGDVFKQSSVSEVVV